MGPAPVNFVNVKSAWVDIEVDQNAYLHGNTFSPTTVSSLSWIVSTPQAGLQHRYSFRLKGLELAKSAGTEYCS
jgi:hypothetical protein